MEEDYYAQLDNLLMEEINIKSVVRPIALADGKDFSLCLNKGTNKYYFSLDGIRCQDKSIDRFRNAGLIIDILDRAYTKK